jgi:hypothetical protein
LRTAQALVSLDICDEHKRELLSVCVWKFTEANGKWHCPHWSLEASRAKRSLWRHEHVRRRSVLVSAMLAEPANVRAILATATACIVTIDEHAVLSALDRNNPECDGWLRYERAGIAVCERDIEP